jgi:glycosyltransferase involved in cell wall biosynthesis
LPTHISAIRELFVPGPTLLSVNNYHYARGGAESVYLNQNQLFEAAGWQVVPFAMHHPQNLPAATDRYFVEDVEFGNDYTLAQTIRRVPRVVYSLEARHKLTALLNVYAPDVCHLHNIYHHISPSILSLLRRRDIPTVMTLHDLKLACPSYKMYTHDGVCERCKGHRHRNLIKHRCIKGSLALSSLIYLETKVHQILDSYARNVNRFVAPSRFLLEKMVEWGIDRDTLVYLPNAVPMSSYVPPQRVGEAFVYIGRVTLDKGVGTLIRAAALAAVPLRVVGTGPDEVALKALARSLGSSVEFTGYLSGSGLTAAVRSARALVLPSELYENAPICVLEAYRDGVPVIGADIGGIPEMVLDGETGLVFESGSVPDLAEKLAAMAAQPDSRVRVMGDAGRQLAEAQYSEPRHYQRLCDLYAGLGVALPADS